ncbi:MAG: serine hydrolase domain-containing protein, partial [Chloroflexota bacterium]
MLLSALRPTLEETLQRSRMKGIAVAMAHAGKPAEVVSLGTDAADAPLSAESLFPVASVTKLATALAVLRLVDADVLSLDDPLARHIPEAVSAAHQGVTLRRLLSHTSGLPLDLSPDEAAYGPGLDWPALAAACLRTALRHPPLTQVQYSNVGYGLLAVAVERRTGQPFPAALRSLVLEPLRIEG